MISFKDKIFSALKDKTKDAPFNQCIPTSIPPVLNVSVSEIDIDKEGGEAVFTASPCQDGQASGVMAINFPESLLTFAKITVTYENGVIWSITKSGSYSFTSGITVTIDAEANESKENHESSITISHMDDSGLTKVIPVTQSRIITAELTCDIEEFVAEYNSNTNKAIIDSNGTGDILVSIYHENLTGFNYKLHEEESNGTVTSPSNVATVEGIIEQHRIPLSEQPCEFVIELNENKDSEAIEGSIILTHADDSSVSKELKITQKDIGIYITDNCKINSSGKKYIDKTQKTIFTVNSNNKDLKVRFIVNGSNVTDNKGIITTSPGTNDYVQVPFSKQPIDFTVTVTTSSGTTKSSSVTVYDASDTSIRKAVSFTGYY